MKHTYIKRIIDPYIKAGNESFIIYPYGQNGKHAEDVLSLFYNIKPRLLVDNQKSLEDSAFIDLTRLSEVIREDDYLILTIHNEKLNREMEEQLTEIMPKERIINLAGIASREYIPKELYKARELLQVDNIFPQELLTANHEKTAVRVGITHTAVNMYNSIKSICDAFEEDNDYDLTVILGEALKRQEQAANSVEKQLKTEHKKYLWTDEYREEDKFDILILTNPWHTSYYNRVAKDAELVVGAFFTLITYGMDDFIQLIKRNTEVYKPEFYLFDRLMYQSLNEHPDLCERLVEMGNAKFDEIYNKSYKEASNCPRDWGKLEGKRVILWATSHGIYSDGISDGITFDIYAQSFFEYAKKHTDLGFIFRPHDLLIEELIECGIWTAEDAIRFKQYCDQSPNIIYDDTDSYEDAYAIADAILTEALCGVLISALPLLKPIGVMYRDQECQQMYYTGFMKDYYSICNQVELWGFLDMISGGDDPMLTRREMVARQLVKHFDGNNGIRIKDYIAGRYRVKISGPTKN